MEVMSKRSKNKKILYTPIKYAQIYLAGIIVLYILGPLEWRTQNPYIFYTFLVVVQILINLGFIREMKHQYNKNATYAKKMDDSGENREDLIVEHNIVIKYLKVFIGINLLITYMYLIRNTGLSFFSLSQIMNNLVAGLSDPGTMYINKFNTEIIFGGSLLAPIITMFSPLLWPVVPLSIIYFKKLSICNKVLVLLTIFFEAARWVSTGSNKGIIDIILIFVAIILIKQWQRRYEISFKVSKGRKKVRTIIIVVVLITIGLSFFTNNISSRVNENYEMISFITDRTEINLMSPLMKVCPKSLQPLLVYTTQYLTQGYYGLSLALDESFIPMFGVGNSYFLIENIEDFFNIDIWQYTYQARIAHEGWNPFVNWHSLYVWLANDVSFFGVLILMYFYGKYFAIVTFKCIAYKDPIASALFCLILLSVFYIPCNNQILSSPITFMAFWGINAYWIYSIKLRKNRRQKIVVSGKL